MEVLFFSDNGFHLYIMALPQENTCLIQSFNEKKKWFRVMVISLMHLLNTTVQIITTIDFFKVYSLGQGKFCMVTLLYSLITGLLRFSFIPSTTSDIEKPLNL